MSPGKNIDKKEPEFAEYTKEPVFSVEHGIYREVFTLEVSSETPGAFISYTIDCSDPGKSKSAITKKSPVKNKPRLPSPYRIQSKRITTAS